MPLIGYLPVSLHAGGSSVGDVDVDFAVDTDVDVVCSQAYCNGDTQYPSTGWNTIESGHVRSIVRLKFDTVEDASIVMFTRPVVNRVITLRCAWSVGRLHLSLSYGNKTECKDVEQNRETHFAHTDSRNCEV